LEAFCTFVPVAESKDKEVGDLGLLVRDVGEARTDAKGVAEGGPEAKDGVAGLVGLGDVGGADGLQSRAEIS
jgi:hypothetical protein